MLIYDKLGYNKIQSRYIHQLLLKENTKYKENYYNEEHNNILKGGLKTTKKIIENSSEEVENIKFIYNNHKIIFQKLDYGDQIHFSLNTLDNKRECLVIILSANQIQTNKKITMCADINQISMYNNCPLVGKMYNGGGTMLLKIAIEFIKSIKKKYNITIIQIKDNGEKICKNKKVKLWLLNTLKNGIPWYIKYNFEPFDEINMCVNELNKVKIIANMRILNRTKTSIIEDEKIFDITDKKINEIFIKYKNKSILKFFNEILNKNCELIENIQEIIIKKLLLFDITGISYYIKLDNDNYKI